MWNTYFHDQNKFSNWSKCAVQTNQQVQDCDSAQNTLALGHYYFTRQCNDAFEVMRCINCLLQISWKVCRWKKFLIGQYLTKLWQKLGGVFFGSPCSSLHVLYWSAPSCFVWFLLCMFVSALEFFLFCVHAATFTVIVNEMRSPATGRRG